jgi:hypothetical protein
MLVPEGWDASKPRPLQTFYNDFFLHALEALSPAKISNPARVLELADKFDFTRTADIVQLELRAQLGTPLFDDVSRRIQLASLLAAGQVLNPEVSRRYIEVERAFKCNIYATDFVGLLIHGAYLPKVAYSFPHRVRKNGVRDSTLTHAAGVTAVNTFVNGKIRNWGGSTFGWVRITGAPSNFSVHRVAVQTEAQERANRGELVIFSADGTATEPGHCGIVVPELGALEGNTVIQGWGNAIRNKSGGVNHIWRSQAGGANGHGTVKGVSILHPSHTYKTPGYFYYDPSTDQSRGEPEVTRLRSERRGR